MGKLDEPAVLDLAARIYAAAAEPERWPGVMEAVLPHGGCPCCGGGH